MAVCNVPKLMAGAGAFGKVTQTPAVMARLALLCQILKAFNPVASCDVPTLMARSSGFGRVTQNPREMLELQLLCEIQAVAGTGGGVGPPMTFGISQGAGAPVAAPAQPNWFYYSNATHNPGVWLWNSNFSEWDEIIAPGP